MHISGNFKTAVVTMMKHVAAAHGVEQTQFGARLTVGLVVRWDLDDNLMWEVLSEQYPQGKDPGNPQPGRRSVQRVAHTKKTRGQFLDEFLNTEVRDKGLRSTIRKAIASGESPAKLSKSEAFAHAKKIAEVENEFFGWTSSGPNDPSGGHAEELMLRHWAETYLRENGNRQPQIVEIVLSRSPCLDMSSAFVYNEYWPEGCAPKLVTAMRLLGSGTRWELAYFELATPTTDAQAALLQLDRAGMRVQDANTVLS